MASMQQNGHHGGGGGEEDDKDGDKKPPYDNSRNNNNNNNNKNGWKTPSQKSAKHNSKKRRSKRGDMTADTCSTATTVTAIEISPMTAASSVMANTDGSHHQMAELEERRDLLQQRMMVLSVTTSAVMLFLVFTLLPFAAVVAVSFLAASAGLLSYTSYQRILLEYQQIFAGQGFARFLSPALYQQLTEQSLHQFLTDDNFVREWGFMALYLVPGLTEEQRNNYIRRLAPDRQTFLERRGLGNLLGDNFMRALVGDQRWRRHAIEASIPAVVHQNPPQPPLQQLTAAAANTTNRRLDFDSDNESSASSTSPDVVGLTIQAVTGNMNALAAGGSSSTDSSNSNDDDARQRQLDEESDVVASAFFSGTWSYVTWLAELGGEAAYDYVVDPTSIMVSAAGIGASFLSLGVGLWGISAGYYSRPSTTTTTFQASSLLPSSRVLVSTALLGGVSAGIMLYARSTARNVLKTPKKPPPKKRGQGDHDKK